MSLCKTRFPIILFFMIILFFILRLNGVSQLRMQLGNYRS